MAGETEMRADEPTSPAEGPKGRTPPYIAYRTLQTLLREFKASGLPPRIDRSVLGRFAGGLQGQIMLALRALGLMDADNRPTPRLAHVVDVYDTPQLKPEMRKIIEETYPYVLALDLTTATPSMFSEAFRNNVDAKEEVLRKVRTFFLHAARDVGIAIGPRIQKAKFPRVRKDAAPKQKRIRTTDERGSKPSDDHSGGMLDKLLAKFPDFDPSWSPELQAKWFAGFEQFMKAAKQAE